MAVAPDVTGANLSTTSAGTSINYTGLTVGAGLSNGALVFGICFDDNRVTGISATWDNGGTNQAMTSVVTKATASGLNGLVALFALVNPTAGNKTLHVAWTQSSQSSCAAASFTGVDQTGGTTSFAHQNSATGNTNTPTVAVTSATNNMVFAVHSSAAAGTFSAVNNTQIFRDNALTNTSNGMNRAAGAASVSMTATDTASGQWASAGFDLVAAATGDTFANNGYLRFM